MRIVARTQAQLREAYQRLKNSRILAVDTETTGLDPYSSTVHSVQIANEDGSFSVLVPRFEIPDYLGGTENQPVLGPLMDLLNSGKYLKVAQNGIFDLKMLLTHYSDFK